jgi:hypothetical protein
MHFLKIKKWPLFFAVWIAFSSCASNSDELTITGYEKGTDATLMVYRALEKCKNDKIGKLIFPKGKYDFWPDLATEKYIFISNNDEGLKRIVFDLSDMKDLVIDGQGSEFLFHGFECPFYLNNSRNIVIKNLSVDYSRTFHSEGKIIASYKDSLDIEFTAEYPYKVDNYKLFFLSDEKTFRDNSGQLQPQILPFWHILEFDAVKREPAYMALDYLNIQNMLVRELRPGVVRIKFAGLKGTLNNILVFNSKDRLFPAFTVSTSENIELNSVNIYHAGGMGFVAQRSRNLVLNNVKVIATPNSGRMLSTVADATHFVNCSGKITLQDCIFESMMDDATNIHGIYVRIEKIIDVKTLLVRLMHFEQWGFSFLYPNTKIEFVDEVGMNTYGEDVVAKSEHINKEYAFVTFTKNIPVSVKVGDIMSSVDENSPEVLIKNCRISKNRARGFLLGSRGKILIENNYFHTQWAAIDLPGDGLSWYEQGGVRDLTIRNNVFDNCNYGGNIGLGVIVVGATIEESKRAGSLYHRNIVIEDNTFRIYNPSILRMFSVDGLVFRNNKIETNSEYPLPIWYKDVKLENFDISDSKNIRIENN